MVIYTGHAEDRVARRFIKKEWVENAIKNPDRLLDVSYGRKQAIKKINSEEISVIYVKEGSNFIVITVFLGQMNMEISLDLKADALYIKFQEGKFAKNKRIDEDTIIDLDAKGRLLGIEMLNVTKKVSTKDLSDVSVKLPLRAHS